MTRTDDVPAAGARTARERSPRGQGDLLRDDVIAALVRIASDDERMRPAPVSLRELAREAGITAPAIYRHFSGTEDVARAAALDGFTRLTAAMDAAAERQRDGSAAERLIALAVAYGDFAAAHRGYFRLMFQSVVIASVADGPAAELAGRWRVAARGLRAEGVEMTDVDSAAMYLWTAVHGRIALAPLMDRSAGPGGIHDFVTILVHEILTVGLRR
ncbi:AcrR family transcriptional regulator [Catenuloplanes nepalensis]|uniref:AcrR family transcriptional regulator n=1 Tax=Catenuloplanes nepalensis TaxID=587533 RepID=A0ABT9MNL8_9ACTN|nr:TetR/AcrR family transcriptional regulator [Catenuloplanes nepalensis]MDP9792988.1 AcrR family transcriptional regulator [Catenuloplanes nepalensis]